MSQLSLFRSEPPASEPRPPDLAYIRKSLNRLLRTVRDAEIMPWSEADAASREKLFSELAALLPGDEAQALTSDFKEELARLRGRTAPSHGPE
jgi:hypothetical protein